MPATAPGCVKHRRVDADPFCVGAHPHPGPLPQVREGEKEGRSCLLTCLLAAPSPALAGEGRGEGAAARTAPVITNRPLLKSRPAGFALLGVLVAFVIAALALGVLFQAALDGLRAVQEAGQYEVALSRAHSHLAAIGRGGPLIRGTRQGDDDGGGGFTWRSRIDLLAVVPVARGDATAMQTGPHVGLYAVGVAISWHAGRREREVVLRTQQVAGARLQELVQAMAAGLGITLASVEVLPVSAVGITAASGCGWPSPPTGRC